MAELYPAPGYDTSGFERPDYLREYGRRPAQPGGAGVPVSEARPRVTLLTRAGCHLCADAREVVAKVASDLGLAWEERDIAGSPDDLARYSDMIPVTLVDGVQHDFWRVSEERLRAALLR